MGLGLGLGLGSALTSNPNSNPNLDPTPTPSPKQVRCAPDAMDGCELLKLAKADFDAGFVRNRGKGLEEKEMRRRLLGFIQMVSPNQRLLLKQDEAAF